MKAYCINPPAADGIKIVREGRCMQRQGAWTAVWAPISLAYCSSILEKEGWEVILSDCIVEDIGFDALDEKVRAFAPDLVIINAVTPSIESDLSTCGRVKAVSPGTLTAVIGIHPTSLPEECLNMAPGLDIVIRGEPEPTVRDIARSMKPGMTAGSLAGIDGVSCRRGGAIVHAGDRTPLANLDELPFPAWHLVDREKYIMPFTDTPFLLLATSRGCPYPCAFCADAAYYGKKLRTRSPGNIVDELAWVRKRFGISEFLFWSESFTIDRAFATAVAQAIIDRGLRVSWVCNSRVDNVDREMLELFRKAGCWMIGFGVESGNQAVLDAMKKRITISQIEAAIRASKEAGLEVTGHSVLGFPGETVSTMKDTIALASRLPFDFVQFYCFVPFPGSPLYRTAREAGWLTTGDWTRFEQNFSVIDTPQLKAEEVMRWRQKAYRVFYLRPRTILRTLKKLRSPRELRNFLRMAADFLSWVK